jgi:hypothetical protein
MSKRCQRGFVIPTAALDVSRVLFFAIEKDGP